MGKRLTEAAVRQYARDGYVAPVAVLTPSEVTRARADLESYEAEIGRPIDFPEKSKSYLLFDWADYLAHHPLVLDAVADVIGPNILVYHSTTWCKEARTPAFVHWHQDGTYFFLEPPLHVTAWIALTDSTPESGCVRVIPGTQALGQHEHFDDPGPWNMIKRGQGIRGRFDAEEGVALALKAGEMSLHHTNVVHCSRGNDSDQRRIGFGLSYVPTEVRQLGSPRASALLVRGHDAFGHFEPEQRLSQARSPAAVAAHAKAVERFRARQDAGMNLREMEAARGVSSQPGLSPD